MRRWLISLVFSIFAAGCGSSVHGLGPDGGQGGGDASVQCSTSCAAGTVCRYAMCVPTPAACTSNAGCAGDTYCDVAASECLPFGVGPGGSNDSKCTREVIPGVFFPGAQCEWLGPAAGEPFPDHKNVLGTPMVATFGGGFEFSRPSIVFISYNFTDGGDESCIGADPRYTGVIRVIDGRSCALQASIAMPLAIPSTALALADLDGDATPEIIAAKVGGGLAAWKFMGPGRFEKLFESSSTYGAGVCNWGGPSVHDLDNDGQPEILLHGAVFDRTGNMINSAANADSIGASPEGYIPVLADVDRDGAPELVSGIGVFGWDVTARAWVREHTLTAAGAQTAVADLGTYPDRADATMDVRATRDGIAEIVAVAGGVVKVFNLFGRVLYTRDIPPEGDRNRGTGGAPTIADFDGDGRAEFATAGAKQYSVFDLDCQGTPTAQTCRSMTTTGVLWTQPSQDASSNVTGSSVFDFEGDGPAEAVYADECFTRVYNGATGAVMYSRYRTSCTWFENPVIADVDGDFSAEIVVPSNTNCNVSCPAVDPIFDGVSCFDDADCPRAAPCRRATPTDKLGQCRCTTTPDCGGDGFVCLDPTVGAAAGKVCRAENPGRATAFGVRVIADRLDRWVNTRPIWNQHAYSVSNVNDSGRVPKTSDWMRNWDVDGLNSFRQNSPGQGAGMGFMADLTTRGATFQCSAGVAQLSTEVCNRGTKPVADGVGAAFYNGASATGTPVCVARTTRSLRPGLCERVTCSGPVTGSQVTIRVDDAGQNTECREDNNTSALSSTACP